MRARGWTWRRIAALVAGALVLAGACSADAPVKRAEPVTALPSLGIHKIKHVVVIMQENRSFDNYFGTFPGATGIPMANGTPTVCAPDPITGTCVAPFVDHNDVSGGGPHGQSAAQADIDGGKMDGFIHRPLRGSSGCSNDFNPVCVRVPARGELPDVMGYHTESDIPNYWTYATSCCKTTCSSRTRRGACPSTCSKSPSGRPVAHGTTTPARA